MLHWIVVLVRLLTPGPVPRFAANHVETPTHVSLLCAVKHRCGAGPNNSSDALGPLCPAVSHHRRAGDMLELWTLGRAEMAFDCFEHVV